MDNSEFGTVVGVVTGLIAVGVGLKLLNRKPKHVREITKQLIGYHKNGKVVQLVAGRA